MVNSRLLVPKLVAPRVGAWIEMSSSPSVASDISVAPLVGAWIEMFGGYAVCWVCNKSLLSWERGLKSSYP